MYTASVAYHLEDTLAQTYDSVPVVRKIEEFKKSFPYLWMLAALRRRSVDCCAPDPAITSGELLVP